MSEKVMLILTNSNNNNNKFYEIEHDSTNDKVTVRYGRVGTVGVKSVVGYGKRLFNSKISSKENKGYRRIDVVDNNIELDDKEKVLSSVVNEKLIDPIIKDEEEKHIVKELINLLFEQNRHAIETFSDGKIKLTDDGEIRTELGLISLKSIQEAQELLKKLEKNYENKDKTFYENLDNYLMLVPQKVPSHRGWADNLVNSKFISNQNSFLDLLEQTIKSNKNKIKDIDFDKHTEEYKKEIEEKMKFNFKISLLKDEKEFKRIKTFFESKKDRTHSSYKLQLKRVYVLTDNIDTTERDLTFEKLGNILELWHGTHIGNVLSILKGGLIIPNENAKHVTGRLFGNGVYFSDNSTKSLNYSNGFWNGLHEDKCFMFLADVAMGKMYTKFIRHYNYPRHGYDSTFAKGKEEYERFGFLQNNEMIVYTLQQFKLKYLCEFE